MVRYPLQKYRLRSLRIMIPAALLVFITFLASWSTYWNGRASIQRVEQTELENLNRLLSRLQGSLSSAVRLDHPETIQSEISVLAVDPDIRQAVLIDHDRSILASMDREMIGMQYSTKCKIAARASSRIEKSLQSMSGTIEVCQDGESVGGTYPILLSPFPGEVRSSRVGMLIVEKDLTRLKEAALANVQREVLTFCLFLLGLTLCIWLYLHSSITRRLSRLVRTTEDLASGNLSSRTGISEGPDELSELAGAVDRMAEQLAVSHDLQVSHAEALTERTQQLDAALAEAEVANNHKAEFMTNMSHEVRTPLTSILGFAELLLAKDQSPENRLEFTRTIRKSGKHLLSIIDDILDLSKIDAGCMALERVPCSPVSILSDVLAALSPLAQEKNLDLDVEFDGPVPSSITSDPKRIRQILTNLLSNAIKFTDRGAIRVRMGLHDPQGSDESALRISVSDTGMGMTAQQQSLLFREFYQAEMSSSRNFGGTGLGLALAKRFAELLGGTITVESALGCGSTFTATVATGTLAGAQLYSSYPDACREIARREEEHAAATARLEAEKTVEDSGLSTRVLLVEDGVDNQRLISFILRKAGAEVEVAENGKEGSDRALETLEAGEPFDLVLMDMQMPVMDGYEATRRLREHGYTGPIVALTAHTMKGDREKCLDAGCDEFARKPIGKPDLLALVKKFATRSVQT